MADREDGPRCVAPETEHQKLDHEPTGNVTVKEIEYARQDGRCKRAHVIAGEIRYVGKETDRKWEEGDEISVLEFAATEYGRKGNVVASPEVKAAIQNIGINKCARESGFDRKNFVRKLVRGLPVKRNSYEEFVRWLGAPARFQLQAIRQLSARKKS